MIMLVISISYLMFIIYFSADNVKYFKSKRRVILISSINMNKLLVNPINGKLRVNPIVRMIRNHPRCKVSNKYFKNEIVSSTYILEDGHKEIRMTLIPNSKVTNLTYMQKIGKEKYYRDILAEMVEGIYGGLVAVLSILYVEHVYEETTSEDTERGRMN